MLEFWYPKSMYFIAQGCGMKQLTISCAFVLSEAKIEVQCAKGLQGQPVLPRLNHCVMMCVPTCLQKIFWPTLYPGENFKGKIINRCKLVAYNFRLMWLLITQADAETSSVTYEFVVFPDADGDVGGFYRRQWKNSWKNSETEYIVIDMLYPSK